MMLDESPIRNVQQEDDCYVDDVDDLDSLPDKTDSCGSQDDPDRATIATTTTGNSFRATTGTDETLSPARQRMSFVVPHSAPTGVHRRRSLGPSFLKGSSFGDDVSSHSLRTPRCVVFLDSNEEQYSGYASKPTDFVSPESSSRRRSWRPKMESPSQQPSSPMGWPSSDSILPEPPPLSPTEETMTLSPNQRPPRSTTKDGMGQAAPSPGTSQLLPPVSRRTLFVDTPSENLTSGSSQLLYPVSPGSDGTGFVNRRQSWAPRSATMTTSTTSTRAALDSPRSIAFTKARHSFAAEKLDYTMSPVPLVSGSPRIWKRPSCDASLLPPAFQASLLASPRSANSTPVGGGGGGRRRTLDVGALERISPRTKEKLMVGKLTRQWPPVQAKSNPSGSSQSDEFLRSLASRSIKDLSSAFSKDMKDQDMQDQSMVPSSSKMTTIDMILRMVHNSSKAGIVTGLHDNAAAALTNRTPNGEQAWIMQKVKEVLQDKVLWSALWAASADINDSDDEDWTSTGVFANLSEATKAQIVSNVVEVILYKEALAGVLARSSPAPDTSIPAIDDLQWQTSAKIHWSGPIYLDGKGIPFCFRGTYKDDAICTTLPLALLLRDRFGDKGQGLPRPTEESVSSRTLLDTDLPDVNDDRDRTTGDAWASVACAPVVWVARWCVSDLPGDDEMWMVTREWNDRTIDEKEGHHQVRRQDLIPKIKELLGIPTNDTGVTSTFAVGDFDDMYNSEAHAWCIEKVYDLNGVIQASSGTMQVDESAMSRYFEEISQAVVNIPSVKKAMSRGSSNDSAVSMDRSTTSPSNDPVSEAVPEPQDGTNDQEPQAETKDQEPQAGTKELEPQTERKDQDTSTESTGMASQIPDTQLDQETPAESPRRSKKKDKKNKKKDKKTPSSIWDLLSPPPVFILEDI